MIREPVRAGSFYPRSAADCAAEAAQYCRPAPADVTLSGPSKGGIVPHAGWMCSGRVAGRVFATIRETAKPRTIVLFGAMHRVLGSTAAMFPSGKWRTPMGTIEVDDRLAERVLGHTNLIREDAAAHEDEHSLEVQVPFIQQLFGDVRVLPILVPPVDTAPTVGQAVGQTLVSYRYEAVVVGSTDLTHYGAAYGFTPEGTGKAGLTWARDVNDRRFIHLLTTLDADALVAEAAVHRNACGAGAAAAAIAAAKQLGATRGVLLEHTTSREVLGDSGFSGSVGYAGVVFT